MFRKNPVPLVALALLSFAAMMRKLFREVWAGLRYDHWPPLCVFLPSPEDRLEMSHITGHAHRRCYLRSGGKAGAVEGAFQMSHITGHAHRRCCLRS
jgi:hypothetical protein